MVWACVQLYLAHWYGVVWNWWGFMLGFLSSRSLLKMTMGNEDAGLLVHHGMALSHQRELLWERKKRLGRQRAPHPGERTRGAVRMLFAEMKSSRAAQLGTGAKLPLYVPFRKLKARLLDVKQCNSPLILCFIFNSSRLCIHFRSLPKITQFIKRGKVSPQSPAEAPFVLWSMNTGGSLMAFGDTFTQCYVSLKQLKPVTRNSTRNQAWGSAQLLNLSGEHIPADWG